MTRPTNRLLAFVLAFACSACASGGITSVQNESEGKGGSQALDVKPPPTYATVLPGRVGMVISTNSRTWADMLGASTKPGVVVLFVQPDGPSDGKGIERGDVLTKVDGAQVRNIERALVLLLSKVGQRRTLDFTTKDGELRTVTVEADDPGSVTVGTYLDPLIAKAPEDAVLYFLRSQTKPKPYADQLNDVQKAIDLKPGFVEALAYRGELVWGLAISDPSLPAEKVEELRDKAIQDWNLARKLDAENTRVLDLLSQALVRLGNYAEARRVARRAIDLDDTFAPGYHDLATANALLGRFDEAASPARRAIDLVPNKAEYYRLLALVFMRLGRKDDATKTVNAIIKLAPDQATRDALQDVLRGKAGP